MQKPFPFTSAVQKKTVDIWGTGCGRVAKKKKEKDQMEFEEENEYLTAVSGNWGWLALVGTPELSDKNYVV